MFRWMAKTNCFVQELFRCEMHSYRDLVVFALFGTHDIPPFGSAEKTSMRTSMRWQRCLGILVLVDDLFKFWHEWWQVPAWLNIGGSTYDPLILQLNNDLCGDGSGKKPWISGLFRCGPGPIRFLAPRLMLVLIITHFWVVIVSEGRRHRPITVLNEPRSRDCSAWWCKMRVDTSSVGDKINQLQVRRLQQIKLDDWAIQGGLAWCSLC